jgi:hypothetical protein
MNGQEDKLFDLHRIYDEGEPDSAEIRHKEHIESRDFGFSKYKGLNLFEGDIDLGEMPPPHIHPVERGKKIGLIFSRNRFQWLNGQIPYQIDSDFSGDEKRKIKRAIRRWDEPLNCIEFYEYWPERGDMGHTDYIFFEKTDEQIACSQIGCRGIGKQIVKFPGYIEGWKISHEVGHVLGLWHEHSRKDRNQHIDILWNNMYVGRRNINYSHKRFWDDYGEYDYRSIMHYHEYEHSKNPGVLKTIIATDEPTKNQRLLRKGRRRISDNDFAAVEAIYRL